MNTLLVHCPNCNLDKYVELDSDYVPDFLKELKGWKRYGCDSLCCPNPGCHIGKHRFFDITEKDISSYGRAINDWTMRFSPEVEEQIKMEARQHIEDDIREELENIDIDKLVMIHNIITCGSPECVPYQSEVQKKYINNQMDKSQLICLDGD